MMLIGREQESEELHALTDTMKVISVGGREGVGKTAFLHDFCSKHGCTYFCTAPDGYGNNMKRLASLFGIDDATDPEEVLQKMSPSDGRTIVAIDDALRFKDIEWIDPPENIVLILCDRGFKDADIMLEPFCLRESGDFFPDFMPREKLLIHAVTGGIPGYMEMFDRGMSVSASLGSLFFSRNGRLVREPERLLRNMGVREPDGYISLMAAISEGADTLNSMVRESDDRSTAAASRHLDAIMGVFVSRHVPEGKVRASYRISDRMTGFWMRFVRPHINEIMSGKQHIFEDIVEEEMDTYISEVFSECCSEYIRDGYGMDIGAWTAMDPDGHMFSSCVDEEAYFISCTWSKRPVGRKGFDALKAFAGRKAPGRPRNYIMFSAGGFGKDMERMSETEDIDLIPLEGMFW